MDKLKILHGCYNPFTSRKRQSRKFISKKLKWSPHVESRLRRYEVRDVEGTKKVTQR
jgi:hypothetical protein